MKNRMHQNFKIANFGHPVFKSWLRPCLCLSCILLQNKKYYIGVKRAVAQMHARGKAANVLDIGTGTGLLSMMAAACGADTVTACEVSLELHIKSTKRSKAPPDCQLSLTTASVEILARACEKVAVTWG